MNAWRLPTAVEVCGQPFAVRSDFRAVLDALDALNDPELSAEEQRTACLQILYPRWQNLPDWGAAFTAAMEFINLGQPVPDTAPRPALVDWSRDVQLIAPAVYEVLGYSCRRCAYLHWWDFAGAYQNASPDGLFGTVVRIRDKRRRGKKLDKAEEEFCRSNPALIQPPHKPTEEEQRLLQLLGE